MLAYDASCGPCTTFKGVVDFLDALGRIEFLSLQEAEGSGLMNEIEPSSRYASFHLFSPASAGRRKALSGPDALLPLARALCPSRTVATAIERAPGGSRLLGSAYSVLSRLHHACPVGLEPGASPPARFA